MLHRAVIVKELFWTGAESALRKQARSETICFDTVAGIGGGGSSALKPPRFLGSKDINSLISQDLLALLWHT
jgi:hypothetical protein